MKKYRNISIICSKYSIFKEQSNCHRIDFTIIRLNFWMTTMHCFEVECILYSNSNSWNSRNTWRIIYKRTLLYSIKSHTLRQFYLQLSSTINYVYVWIIDDSITSRNAIHISFRWSKRLWSKYKIANIWSSWTSYSSSTNFEWVKRVKNSSRLLSQWNRTNIEYYLSN